MADDVLLLDTSAAIPLVVGDHPARPALLTRVRDRSLGLAGHALFETYSVLTRMPPPHRVTARTARRIIERGFPARPAFHLANTDLLGEFASLGIVGGAVFDALVAAAARESGLLLVSRDRRAAVTYRTLGARYELI